METSYSDQNLISQAGAKNSINFVFVLFLHLVVLQNHYCFQHCACVCVWVGGGGGGITLCTGDLFRLTQISYIIIATHSHALLACLSLQLTCAMYG